MNLDAMINSALQVLSYSLNMHLHIHLDKYLNAHLSSIHTLYVQWIPVTALAAGACLSCSVTSERC